MQPQVRICACLPCIDAINLEYRPMLLWIAAIGSTWGAYALGVERLMGAAGRAEAGHGGSKTRREEEARRKDEDSADRVSRDPHG